MTEAERKLLIDGMRLLVVMLRDVGQTISAIIIEEMIDAVDIEQRDDANGERG